MVNLDLVESRTVATTVLVIVGLYLILALEASGLRRGAAVSVMCLGLAVLYIVVLTFPTTRDFFELSPPTFAVVTIAVAGAALSIVGLALTDERFVPPLAREVGESHRALDDPNR